MKRLKMYLKVPYYAKLDKLPSTLNTLSAVFTIVKDQASIEFDEATGSAAFSHLSVLFAVDPSIVKLVFPISPNPVVPVVFKNTIVTDCPTAKNEFSVVVEFPRTFKGNAAVAFSV
jgi:hypothetical protein